ncbi:hypothetical protein SKAU_G00209170 [Synaphobranchus kaupii]|uniref:Uncharacterized protein n=1 Tax=Synaphobranchus kaupii TaxID=118154 RepID=A0A9Q1F8P1_SYNKA|nr:hypothetical protein SKAU_G00209170 [Synaphobranchus kaupii]
MEQQNQVEQTQKTFETRSQVSSKSSGKSSRSSASAAATKARAKAEAARVEVSYAEKEAAMMREKARIEASLYVLQKQRSATAASAEAAVYVAAAEMEEEPLEDLAQITAENRAQRTSDAQFKGISLNDTLLSGPDLNNTLLGVLLRFRKEQVAVTVDVEQMFYCFRVREDYRNYLRFLSFKHNDLSKEVTEFRMKVPVFGNSSSPAVAIYGLRRAAELGEEDHGSDAC